MLKAILQMYCHPSGEDKFIWTPDPKGLFSTRSAFQLTMRSNNFSHSFLNSIMWKKLWGLPL